ncbi:DNA topoisomerase IB [Pseudoalteromonas ruthenica]|uniref:DNA topoisomerase IB n=1 Tax=Pseudoalteromonas ruthenica TaxID=151081 RepID=UPI00241FCF7D|nr:DNA topoisomerase IB [Pseudoalteromonas ruthenica]|tara:strand:- start:12362 stop:13384 length:1023 start_codon:yes stop_codon:yes gene_type:complete
MDCNVAPSTTYHECNTLTTTRRKRGKGFEYFHLDKEKITSRAYLKRMRELVVPPMWRDVRISACQYNKVQAVGVDGKGKRQYIYHAHWQLAQQQKKFAKLGEFAAQLPDARGQCLSLLAEPDWTKDKVCALGCAILDLTAIRVGNNNYYKANETCGLTTLRRKHVDIKDDHVQFSFKGKHAKHREVRIDDTELAELVASSAEQQGYSLLRYYQQGQWHDLQSDDINEFIHRVFGGHFSAKDYRTWAGTRMAVRFAHVAAEQVQAHPRRKFKSQLVKLVAKQLGNTANICEQYYIHPKVLEHLSEHYENEHAFAHFDATPRSLAEELDMDERHALAIITGR